MSKEKKQKKKNKDIIWVFTSVRSVPQHSTDLNERQIRALFNAMHDIEAGTRKLIEARRIYG